MKNKSFLVAFLLVMLIAVSSCAGAKGGQTGYKGSHRKGYGCPTSAY